MNQEISEDPKIDIVKKVSIKLSFELVLYSIFWLTSTAYIFIFEYDFAEELFQICFPYEYLSICLIYLLSILLACLLFVPSLIIFPVILPVAAVFVYAFFAYLALISTFTRSIIIFIIIFLVLYLIGSSIYNLIKNIDSVKKTIRESSKLILKNFHVVLLTSLLAACVLLFQVFVFLVLIKSSNIVFYIKNEFAMISLPLLLAIFLGIIIYNFIVVFISSVIYNTAINTKRSLFSSLICTLSAFPAILRSSFCVLFFIITEKYFQQLYDNELKKDKKNKNMICLSLLNIIIYIINLMGITLSEQSTNMLYQVSLLLWIS